MRRLPLALLGLVARGLIACGSEEGGDEEEIRTVIEASAMSSYPADCTRYLTLNMLEQNSKRQGRAAVQECEATALETSVPDAVWSSDIEVDGNRATARVDFEGSASDGQAYDIALREIDGQWKLHEILSFAVFDREKMIVEWGRKALEKVRSPEQADIVACVIDEFEKLSDADLEALVLDPSPEPAAALVRPCEPRSATA